MMRQAPHGVSSAVMTKDDELGVVTLLGLILAIRRALRSDLLDRSRLCLLLL